MEYKHNVCVSQYRIVSGKSCATTIKPLFIIEQCMFYELLSLLEPNVKNIFITE